MFITAIFYFYYSIALSAFRPESANRMEDVIGDRFSSLKVTKARTRSYFLNVSNDLNVFS